MLGEASERIFPVLFCYEDFLELALFFVKSNHKRAEKLTKTIFEQAPLPGTFEYYTINTININIPTVYVMDLFENVSARSIIGDQRTIPRKLHPKEKR